MLTIELTLRALRLDAPFAIKGHSLLLAHLILPRPGIQSRSSLKTLELKRGRTALQRAPFYETALLKEKVDGRFGLQIRLTRPQANLERAQFLQAVLASGIEAAGDTLAAQIPLSSLRGLARAPFDQMAEVVEDDSPEFILEAGIDLDSEALTAGVITLPLKLSETIRHNPLPPGPKSREQRKAKTQTYKKGLTLGEAVLDLRL